MFDLASISLTDQELLAAGGSLVGACLVILAAVFVSRRRADSRGRERLLHAHQTALRQLHSSVSDTRAMLDQAPMTVLVFDRSSPNLLFANRQALELFGCTTVSELSDRVFSRPDHWQPSPYSLLEFESWLQKVQVAGMQQQEWLFSDEHRRGTWIACSLGNSVFEGRPARLLCGHNIHSYRMGRVADKLRNRVLTGINAGSPLPGLLDSLCKLAEITCHECCCHISLYDEQRDMLVNVGASDFSRKLREALPTIPARYGQTSIGTAAHSKSRVVCESLIDDHRWNGFGQLVERLGAQSAWSEPVLSQKGELLAVLTIFSDARKKPSDDVIEALGSVISLTGLAIERHSWRQRLESSASSERFIRQVGVDLVNLPSGPEFVEGVRLILHRVISQYELGAMALWELPVTSENMVCLAVTRMSTQEDALLPGGEAARLPVSEADIRSAVSGNAPEYVMPDDSIYGRVRLAQDPKPVLLVPLYKSGTSSDLLGFLAIQSQFFFIPQINIDHLTIIGSMIRTSLMNRSLMQTLSIRMVNEREAKEKLEGELTVARTIQMSMVPGGGAFREQYKNWSIEGWLQPARAVGGDLYEFIRLPNGQLLIAVGDVSDKGAAAALFMARTVSLLNYLARSKEGDLAVIARALNEELCRANDACMFVTLLMAVLDLSSGEVQWLSAGHCMPMQTSVTEAPRFWEGESGPPLGLYDDISFPVERCAIPPGGSVTIYTDGVTEAFNRDFVEFGEDRLLNLGYRAGRQDDGLLAYMREQILLFTGDAPQSDDITLMTIQHHGY